MSDERVMSTEAELPPTIEAAASALRDGTMTSVALTEAMLARAERHDGLLEVWSGGSSSGSGSGLAAGRYRGAIATNMAGSIRIPAAHCGVSGLVPTFGQVPKDGCVQLAFSLDHVGPLARTAWDCAAMLNAMAGPDPGDPDSADASVPDYLAGIEGRYRRSRSASSTRCPSACSWRRRRSPRRPAASGPRLPRRTPAGTCESPTWRWSMDDEAAVKLLLGNCGFDPPAKHVAAMALGYPPTRAMAASLFTVGETREETSALGFRVIPETDR
jgi:hypothetical protein